MPRRIMNSKELTAIDLLILAVMAMAWAIWQALRLLVPLLAVAVVLLTPRRRPAPEPAPIAPEPAPVAAQPVLPAMTLASLAAELQALPAAELRQITGTRRKVAKVRMVEAWLAMPV